MVGLSSSLMCLSEELVCVAVSSDLVDMMVVALACLYHQVGAKLMMAFFPPIHHKQELSMKEEAEASS